jgi:hypothetical protein
MVTPVQKQKAQSFLGQVYQDALAGIGGLFPQKVKQGFQAGVELMSPQARAELRDESGERILSSISNYSTVSPKFKKELAEVKGITLQDTPQQFLGAYAARILTDVGTDSTRHLYWRYNHPMAIADTIIEKAAGPSYQMLNPTQKATVGLMVGAPTAASLGVFDITNPGELFRPKGFAQSYAEEGSEDRRESTQPGLELVERMFLGRQGRPLKYETAKEDIPDLTKERYSNYMKNYYQDKGITGLGLVKFTPENLQGEPEARIVGFPIGLQSVGALAGGATALRSAMKSQPPVITEMRGTQEIRRRVPGATRRAAGITLAGSLAGALAGNLTNKAIASLNNNPERLPDTLEYQPGV